MSLRRGDARRIIQPASSGIVLPSAIPGLTSWFVASAGIGVADGQPVGTWTDQSGAGLCPTMTAAGAARPTFVASGINGKPDVTFDGSAQRMAGSNTLLSGAQAVSLFGIFQAPVVAADRFLYGMQFNGFEYSAFLKLGGTIACFAGSGTNTLTSPGTYENNAPHCWIWTCYLVSGAMALYIDSTTAVATGSGASGTITNGVLDKNAIGSSTGAAGNDRLFTGHLPEQGSYNVALSAGNAGLLMTYLKSQAGI